LSLEFAKQIEYKGNPIIYKVSSHTKKLGLKPK